MARTRSGLAVVGLLGLIGVTGCGSSSSAPADASGGADALVADAAAVDAAVADAPPSDASAADAAAACPDGHANGSEDCDGTDLAGASCFSVSAGALPGGALHCTAACTFDTAECTADDWEAEPNDSAGTADDFTALDVVPAGGDLLLSGVREVDDEDWFAFTVPDDTGAAFVVETFDGAYGSVCTANAIDSALALYDATGTALATDDDGGDGLCSRLTGVVGPGTYSLRVRASDFAPGATFDYTLGLDLTAVAVTCGDDHAWADEACDGADLRGRTCGDEGHTAGQLGCAVGCDAYVTTGCVDAVAELEPNDDAAGADANGALMTSGGLVIQEAAIAPIGDLDVVAITNDETGAVLVTAETFGPDGLGTCAGIDTVIAFRDTFDSWLEGDDDSGIAACSLQTYTIFPGETQYVHVGELGADAAIAAYYLQLSFAPG